MKKHLNKKQALYESIMRNIAKTVKRALNESMDSLENEILDYIHSDNKLYAYYQRNFDGELISSYDISSCVYNFDDGNIYYNPDFMDNLSPIEKVFVVFHSVTAPKFYTDFYADGEDNIEHNIMLDKKINNYLESTFPQFRGITKKLKGYI